MGTGQAVKAKTGLDSEVAIQSKGPLQEGFQGHQSQTSSWTPMALGRSWEWRNQKFSFFSRELEEKCD